MLRPRRGQFGVGFDHGDCGREMRATGMVDDPPSLSDAQCRDVSTKVGLNVARCARDLPGTCFV